MITQKKQQIAGVVAKADADKVIAASAQGKAPAAAVRIDLTAAPAQAALSRHHPLRSCRNTRGMCLHSATASK